MTDGVFGTRNLRRVLRAYRVVGVSAGVFLWALAGIEVVSEPPVPEHPTVDVESVADSGTPADVGEMDGSRFVLWSQPSDSDVGALRCSTPLPDGTSKRVRLTDVEMPPGWEIVQDSNGSGSYRWAGAINSGDTLGTISCEGPGMSTYGLSSDQFLRDYETDARIPGYLGVGAVFLLSGVAAGFVSRRVYVAGEGQVPGSGVALGDPGGVRR